MKEKIDELLEKIKSLDEKTCLYIFVGVLFLIFILDYLILMRPQLKTLTKISPEIKILRDDIKKANIELGKVNHYRDEVKKYKADIERANVKVRSKEEVPLILEKISNIANKNGVKLDQIMPITQDNEIVLENDERIYYGVPVIIEAKSGYHDFGRFLNQLEHEDIQLVIESFSMTARGEMSPSSVKLTLNTIVYEDK